MLGVLGAGSWGTALALRVSRNGSETLLWEHTPATAQKLQQEHANNRFLPDIAFPENLAVTADLAECVDRCDQLLVVVPSVAFSEVVTKLKPMLKPEQGLAWATKGLSQDGRLLNQVATETLGNDFPLAVLSGPSFALEVARQRPTAISLATNHTELGDRITGYLHHELFRIYTCKDITGVCLGGAYKNVLAIAAGISDGLELGHNARAALITRGLAEMQRLGMALGGHPETFMGLAGLGDLVLTCTGDLSRNRRLGLALAKGDSLDKIQSDIGQVTEGVETARVVHRLATAHQAELPISEEVYQILFKGRPPKEAVHDLLSRAAGQEF